MEELDVSESRLLDPALELSDNNRSRISCRCSPPSDPTGLPTTDPWLPVPGDDRITSSETRWTARRSGRRGVPDAGDAGGSNDDIHGPGLLADDCGDASVLGGGEILTAGSGGNSAGGLKVGGGSGGDNIDSGRRLGRSAVLVSHNPKQSMA